MAETTADVLREAEEKMKKAVSVLEGEVATELAGAVLAGE